jgi:hypothetical protein
LEIRRWGETWDMDKPTLIVGEALIEMIQGGELYRNKKMMLIFNIEDATSRMPEGKRGIVLGPSDVWNTRWQNAGWDTLDKDKKAKATYTVDLNRIETHPRYQEMVRSYDFLFSRYMTFGGKELSGGITPQMLLSIANKILAREGIIAVETGFSAIVTEKGLEKDPLSFLPDLKKFVHDMINFGFTGVSVVVDPFEFDTWVDPTDSNKGYVVNRKVTYYGMKTEEGWEDRTLKSR